MCTCNLVDVQSQVIPDIITGYILLITLNGTLLSQANPMRQILSMGVKHHNIYSKKYNTTVQLQHMEPLTTFFCSASAVAVNRIQ